MFLGRTLVFYRLSPYYGALGLVLVAIAGCLLCGLLGMSFVALVLVLIYMGGMLVVFVYSTAISAERYPVVREIAEIGVLGGLVVFWVLLNFDPLIGFSSARWDFLSEGDFLGRSSLYLGMGCYLLIGGLVLLLALVGVLVVTYGPEYKVLKAL